MVELLRETGRFGDITAVKSVLEARAVLARTEFDADVVFGDIRLVDRPNDISGLALCRELAGRFEPPMIVLATASAEHAVQGFELCVVDYLLKPFSIERVLRCAERLDERRRPSPRVPRSHRLVARRGAGLVFLEFDGLLAFQASDRLT